MLTNVTIALLYKLHSSIYAGESLCYMYSICTENTTTQVPTTALPLTITAVLPVVITVVLGVIVLVLLIVCTVALRVCLRRKQARMKREIIGNYASCIMNVLMKIYIEGEGRWFTL